MAWHDPTNDGRWPVPPIDAQPDDIRVTVGYAMRTDQLMQGVRELFQNSDEMRQLSHVFGANVDVHMGVTSSRKYTKFEFPRCPNLLEGLVQLLAYHGLEAKIDSYTYQWTMLVQVSTVRIGAVNETITYGKPECPVPTSTS